MCGGVFCVTFFAFHTPFSLFVFHSISHQGRYSREKSKNVMVYFFVTFTKHEIHMKYEKCIVSASYFVVCFAKYLLNAKYEKCIASLRDPFYHQFITLVYLASRHMPRVPQLKFFNNISYLPCIHYTVEL